MPVWMLWFVACGPPSAPETRVPAERSPASELDVLTVATWNIEWLDAQTGSGRRPRTDADYQELAAVIASVDADVWAFQEVSDARAVHRVVPQGWTVRVEERRADQRVAFAVRPGLDVSFHEETRITLGRSGLRRGLVASVAGVEVMTVHLKAGCQWDPFERSDDCRTVGEQLAHVESWLDAASGTAVVIGDYNRQLSHDDEGWLAIHDGDPVPLVAPLLSARDRCPGSRARHPIDQAIVRGLPDSAVTAEQVPNRASSDHCPVIVRLDLPD